MNAPEKTASGGELLPDTERGEYLAQKILGGKLAGNLPKRVLSQPQILRNQLESDNGIAR